LSENSNNLKKQTLRVVCLSRNFWAFGLKGGFSGFFFLAVAFSFSFRNKI
jgi:hypothetical protein